MGFRRVMGASRVEEILGIDLSAWRSGVTPAEFAKLHEGGCRFLGVRVSSGRNADDTAAGFVQMARAHGWVTFGYHYLSAAKGDPDPDVEGHIQGGLYADRALMLDLDGHFLDVEDADLKWGHVIHAVHAMRKSGITSVGLYSRQSFYGPKFEGAVGVADRVFDCEWWADYRGGSRWLGNWQTSEAEEKYRPGALWQMTDKFRYRRPDAEGTRSIDGNVFVGTQQALMRYLKGGRN